MLLIKRGNTPPQPDHWIHHHRRLEPCVSSRQSAGDPASTKGLACADWSSKPFSTVWARESGGSSSGSVQWKWRLGSESLSRGASLVLSVEKSSKHARWIKGNISKCGMPTHRHRMKTQDVFTLIPQLITLGERFDLIMADPPFGDKNRSQRSTSLSQKLLDLENMPSLLKSDGMFLLGHAKRDELSLTPWWVCRKP